MRKLWVMSFVLIFAACASPPVRVKLPEANFNRAPARTPASLPPSPLEPSDSSVDYVSLQRSLGLDRNPQQLGYNEKAFDTCRVGYGYSSTHDCHQEYFVVINFQLVCRDSEGTISTPLTEFDMHPLTNRQVRWSLKNNRGQLLTDADGFGQIVTTAGSSHRHQRLRLTVGEDFLYMRAGEITRVVTPKPWCN